MFSKTLLPTLGVLLALPHNSLQADEDFGICTTQDCGECPFYADKNAGFPDCVIYHRDGLKDLGLEEDKEG